MNESSHPITCPKTSPAEVPTINFDHPSYALGPYSTINNNKMTVIALSTPVNHQQNPLPNEPMNLSCYNLIVLEEEFLCRNYVTIPNELVFNESISPQLQERFCRLDASAQAELCSFPCIFASPNHHGNKTDADHQAYFGKITDMARYHQSVHIRYSLLTQIPQQRRNEIVSDLQLRHTDLSNEFDTPHWTVKEANLISVFHRNSIPLPF